MMSRHPPSLKLHYEHRVEDGDEGDGRDEANDQRIDYVDAGRGAFASVTCRYVYQTAACIVQQSNVQVSKLTL